MGRWAAGLLFREWLTNWQRVRPAVFNKGDRMYDKPRSSDDDKPWILPHSKMDRALEFATEWGWVVMLIVGILLIAADLVLDIWMG